MAHSSNRFWTFPQLSELAVWRPGTDPSVRVCGEENTEAWPLCLNGLTPKDHSGSRTF